jgi:mannose-1-phosphate guanylyltransferase
VINQHYSLPWSGLLLILHPPTSTYQPIFSINRSYKNNCLKFRKKTFFLKPEKKDVGPAIALVMGSLQKKFPHEPVAILWSDHLVKQVALFKKMLATAGQYIEKNPQNIIFIAHKPRYESTNLGYIHIGQKLHTSKGFDMHSFEGFKYRPDAATAKKFFQSGSYAWNLGYFVSTPQFITDSFERFAPNIWENTHKILAHMGSKDYESILKRKYGQVESINLIMRYWKTWIRKTRLLWLRI